LANDPACFLPDELLTFSQEVYATLESHTNILPPRFLTLLPYMKSQNWLYHYKDREGINKSLHGLVRRAAYLSDAETAFRLFEEHLDALRDCYDRFFKDVKTFAKGAAAQLLI